MKNVSFLAIPIYLQPISKLHQSGPMLFRETQVVRQKKREKLLCWPLIGLGSQSLIKITLMMVFTSEILT